MSGFSIDQIVGLHEKDAVDMLTANGLQYLVIKRDGKSMVAVMDLRRDRAQLEINKNIVTLARVG